MIRQPTRKPASPPKETGKDHNSSHRFETGYHKEGCPPCDTNRCKDRDHHDFPCFWLASFKHHKKREHCSHDHDQAAYQVFPSMEKANRQIQKQWYDQKHQSKGKPGSPVHFPFLFHLPDDHPIGGKGIFFQIFCRFLFLCFIWGVFPEFIYKLVQLLLCKHVTTSFPVTASGNKCLAIRFAAVV